MANKKNPPEPIAGTPRTIESPAEKKPATKTLVKKARVTLRDIDLNELVEVQSCFYGHLVYVSKKTGYTIEWSEFGEVQPMPVDEILTMRNSSPAFFKNQWVRLVGDNAADVMSYAQIDRFYKDILPFEDFDEIFTYEPDEIETIIERLSPTLKETIARRTLELVNEKEITNNLIIEAVEKASGFEIR